jgi:TIR domain
MATKIFISYRRDDSAGHAGRVHDRLEREFGPDLLFMDVDAIPLGLNFIKVLREEVAKCDVLLALIGPSWLSARDEEGNRRLDNPSDFLRIEIATALQRDTPVIPILLDGARMPKSAQLPKDLEELAVRNGLDIRHASFHIDMGKLIRALKNLSGPTPNAPRSPQEERRENAETEAKLRRRRSGASQVRARQERPGRRCVPPFAWASRSLRYSSRFFDRPIESSAPKCFASVFRSTPTTAAICSSEKPSAGMISTFERHSLVGA